MLRNLIAILFISTALHAVGQSSVLSTGVWYKLSIADAGVYKMDYAFLQKAGINPSQINPKNIRLYTGQPGMLPQPNSAPRVNDLAEVPITVVGEEDGKFDAGDYILFYGLGPDLSSFDPKSKLFSYQNNIYTDKNFYFLTVSASPGERVPTRANAAGSFPVITQFDDFAYYESDQYNILHSGRQWFGEQFDQGLQITIGFDLPGIVPNSSILLTSHVMAQSTQNSSFAVSYNNIPILTQPVTPWPNTTYGAKGVMKIDTITIAEGNVNASAQSAQQIKYVFTKGSIGVSVGYLDYVLFATQRILARYGNQTTFTSGASVNNPVSTFQVNTTTSTDFVWEVTLPFKVRNQSFTATGTSLSFSTATDSLRKFVVFDPTKVTAPLFESTVTNQNLHGVASANLLIIATTAFAPQAQRLASYRQSHNQLTTLVVTTETIFNEYGGGKSDPTAIRDFIRDVYKKGGLQYVLLFGRGSYDYKNRVYSNTNFVPIYESYESLEPLATYSSDDYYGFMQNNEGSWDENPAVNYAMDLGVGRIPVKSLAEATTVVDKLIEYDSSPDRFGPWRNEFLFVADDGDYDLHVGQADQMANSIEQNHPEFNAEKLWLDSFKQIEEANGQVSPDATKALDLALRKGVALVNYTGHGSEQVWAQEQILTPDLVTSLKNGPQYPLFVTATCEFGRNDDPSIISSAELAILQQGGGGIALVTTARPVNSSSNFQLNQAFYQALFTKTGNQFRRLGDIMRDTKNNSLSDVSNRNFSLLGDPSLTLALADKQVVINSITTSSDTLKALSQVLIQGEVQSNSSRLTSFNGTVYATLFDQIQNLTTRGDPDETITAPSPPYPFIERANRLFQGTASVQQGVFQFSFQVPDDLVSGFGNGKLNLYANSSNGVDANGATTNFIVGGLEKDPPLDATPPVIKLYVSDTTFINGGTVGPNTQMVAYITDASGINITSINSQSSIIATLDNKWSYNVNTYFRSANNDVTGGSLTYPLDTLKKGIHQLSLSASDTYNNRTTATITFVVTDGNGIAIGEFFNYPNPFTAGDNTIFRFSHTRAGEDLQATLVIYDLTGRPVTQIEYNIASSTYQIDLGQWNGENTEGTKLGSGIYVARLSVRSEADGSQCDRATKLIILN